MFTTEYRDLFGNWQPADHTFDTLAEAELWCLEMSAASHVAYRILDSTTGEVVKVVGLEADFGQLPSEPSAL